LVLVAVTMQTVQIPSFQHLHQLVVVKVHREILLQILVVLVVAVALVQVQVLPEHLVKATLVQTVLRLQVVAVAVLALLVYKDHLVHLKVAEQDQRHP
jgi:hypothetical protein